MTRASIKWIHLLTVLQMSALVDLLTSVMTQNSCGRRSSIMLALGTNKPSYDTTSGNTERCSFICLAQNLKDFMWLFSQEEN